jgi:hypothetical protein
VIAQDADELGPLSQFDQGIEYASGIGTPIDIVPQRDHDILWIRLHGRDQRFQGFATAVDVTDGDQSIAHALLVRVRR